MGVCVDAPVDAVDAPVDAPVDAGVDDVDGPVDASTSTRDAAPSTVDASVFDALFARHRRWRSALSLRWCSADGAAGVDRVFSAGPAGASAPSASSSRRAACRAIDAARTASISAFRSVAVIGAPKKTGGWDRHPNHPRDPDCALGVLRDLPVALRPCRRPASPTCPRHSARPVSRSSSFFRSLRAALVRCREVVALHHCLGHRQPAALQGPRGLAPQAYELVERLNPTQHHRLALAPPDLHAAGW